MPSTSVFRGGLINESISINVAGAADVTLAVGQARNADIVLTGAITAALNIIIPVADPDDFGLGPWTFTNNTTGAFNLGVKQPGGTALILPQGLRTPVLYTSSGFREANTSVAPARVDARYVRERFYYEPVAVARAGAGAATGVAGDRNLLQFPNTLFEYHIKGTQTIVAPVLTAVGLDLGSMDQTAGDGLELTHGILSRSPVAFTVGTDAAFFVQATIKVEDASGANPLLIGFRKAEAYQATQAAYADYAMIGIIGTANPNTIKTTTEAAGAGNTDTDTTMTWADGATKQLKVKVSSAGVVTYEVNNAAPTVVAAFSFTAGDIVIPEAIFIQAADIAGKVEWSNWEVGFQ